MIQEKCQSIISPVREDKTLTVGIGFQCPGAVVLGSDRQITKAGGLKYEQCKILSAYLGSPNLGVLVACTYAHDPDIAANLMDDIAHKLPITLQQARTGGAFFSQSVKEMLEGIFSQKKARDMEMLIAFGHPTNAWSPFLMRARGPTVVQGAREYIGAGDSSILRYIGELLGRFQLTVEEAPLAAFYLVSLATRFVDRCDGDPDILIMFNGKAEIASAQTIEQAKKKMSGFDSNLASSLWSMLEHGGQSS